MHIVNNFPYPWFAVYAKKIKSAIHQTPRVQARFLFRIWITHTILILSSHRPHAVQHHVRSSIFSFSLRNPFYNTGIWYPKFRYPIFHSRFQYPRFRYPFFNPCFWGFFYSCFRWFFPFLLTILFSTATATTAAATNFTLSTITFYRFRISEFSASASSYAIPKFSIDYSNG